MDEKELSICKKCGKEFKDHISLTRHISRNNGKNDHPKTVKEYYDTYLLKEGEGKCIVCGNPTIFNRINIGYYKTCSNKCAQLNPETRKKIEATSLDLYGVKHPLQNINVKNKMLNTWNNKTGEINNLKKKDICIAPKEIKIIKEDILKIEGIKNQIFKPILTKTENYQTLVSSYIPSPIISKSNIVKEIEEFLSNNDIQYRLSNDLFFINETLILFPVCIEELSTINEEYFYNSKKLKKYYSSLLIDNPTFKKVVVLFSDEWVYKNEISKSRIINNSELITKKIFARKCVVKEVDYTIKNEFLDRYHIQGKDSSKIKLGLYTKDDELVSIMTFSKGSVSKGAKQSEKIFELNRFCSKNNYLVIGGASKLLSYFENVYKPEEIYSYADKRWSNGNLYKTLGFEYNSETEPNYWYIINKRRLHRFNFRKDQLKKYSNYDDNKTEQEIMCELGIPKIYDCGSFKFIKHLITV